MLGEPLALPMPYGYRIGTTDPALAGRGIQMHAPRDAAEEVCELAIGYGCPEEVIGRVRASVTHSGRYDCFVTASVRLRRLAEDLHEIGGRLVVTQ